MFKEPELEVGRLQKLRGFLNELPPERLSDFVKMLDPEREGSGGRQRATRTVEMALLTGRPLSWWHEESEPPEDPLKGMIFLLEN